MKTDASASVYWLRPFAGLGYKGGNQVPLHTQTLEAEDGYKACKKPGLYHAWQTPLGLCCPGCDRSCRIPATARLQHGDAFYAFKR